MEYYVYILSSLRNGSYYKGSTDNPQRRLQEHNAGKEQATSRYTPWEMVCSIKKKTRSEAFILERKIKNITSRTKLDTFIRKYKD